MIILDARLEAKEGSVDLMCRARRDARGSARAQRRAGARALATRSPIRKTMSELQRILKNYPGETEVTFRVQTPEGEQVMKLGDGWKVAIHPGLRAELREPPEPEGAVVRRVN